MKLTTPQFLQIKKFAIDQVWNNDIWHQPLHLQNTALLAKTLAKKERGDINKCLTAAWLHDIAKYKEEEGINHGQEGARLSYPFLIDISIPKKDAEEICYAIAQHNQGGEKTTLEAKIIWDADKLQVIGAYGFLRTYGYYLSKGITQKEAYEITLKEQKFALSRFYTKTARKFAEQSTAKIKPFHENYLQILKAHF